MTARTLTTDAPARGFFVSTICAPADWPEVLVGTRGEMLVRKAMLGSHNAVFALFGMGDSIDRHETYGAARVTLTEPHDGVAASVRFAPHPSVADDVSELIPAAKLDGKPMPRPDVLLHESSKAHQCWMLDWPGVACLFATMHSNSSIVDYVLCGRTNGHLVLEFGEPIVGLSEAGIVALDLKGSDGRVHFKRFRMACRSWTDRNPDHALADLTHEEQAYAGDGPWFGKSDDPMTWLGVDYIDGQIEPWDMTLREPRSNPNVGGTDPAFGAVVHLNEITALEIATALSVADKWGRHPMFPSVVGNWPIEPPPAHEPVTTHKRQICLDSRGNGIGPVDGKHPMDSQHLAMMLPLTVYGMTADPGLRYMLELWLGAEAHDRAVAFGWPQNGRAEGRVAYNVQAALDLGLGDQVALNYYLRRRHDLVEFVDVDGDRPSPMFVLDRGVPWPAWTPWEEAQAAWGWWRMGETAAAWACAHNVASVLRKSADGGWWIPYRAEVNGDGVKSELHGPNGLFAWAALGLRVYVLAWLEESEGDTVLIRNAIDALDWLDLNQRPHAVDARMSLRGAFRGEIERARKLLERMPVEEPTDA